MDTIYSHCTMVGAVQVSRVHQTTWRWRLSLPVFFATILATGAWAGQGDSANAVVEVKAADAAWAEAASSKSVERMMEFYDKEAVFIAQDGKVISGREGLKAAWTAFFSVPGITLSWQAHAVRESQAHDLAFSYGSWEIEQGPPGQKTKRSGTYVFIWKRQENGKWKVLVDKP